jgi:hypothetical protein
MCITALIAHILPPPARRRPPLQLCSISIVTHVFYLEINNYLVNFANIYSMRGRLVIFYDGRRTPAFLSTFKIELTELGSVWYNLGYMCMVRSRQTARGNRELETVSENTRSKN